jgi:hypothetical protein
VGLGLATVGVSGLATRHRRVLLLTGTTFFAFVLYGLAYYVPDISVFLLPAHLILAIWIGAGIATLAELLSRVHRPSLAILSLSLIIPLALLPLSRIWSNLPQIKSHKQGNLAWGRYVLSLPLAEGSAVLADMGKFAPLYYLQQVEDVRPDLDLLVLGNEELYQAELATRLRAGQTVYLARYLPHLGGLHLRSVGPLVEVGGEADVEGMDGKRASFGEAIQLSSAETSIDPLGRALYHLTLYWQAQAQVNGDFIVRLRLVDATGHVAWESDGTRPVNGFYPTNAWPDGVTIPDYHEIPIPPWLPRGTYELQIGLFHSFSDTGLNVDEIATPWLSIQTLELDPPSDPSSLPYEWRYSFSDGAWLTGYNASAGGVVDTPFVVDLAWREVEANEEVHLTWVDDQGQRATASVLPLVAESLRSRHAITTPQRPGRYTLHVGLVDEVVRCHWLAAPTADCPLATVEVLPAQEGLANFADMILLLSAETNATGPRPGEVVSVKLSWRGLRDIEEDYTAFVHLVGPDGRLHGQVDTWPVQGTHPTTQWTLGNKVDDPYKVQLAPNAPPGHYRIEVGWYLLATMQRLEVIDPDGHPIGDSFIVGEFDVLE